MTLLPARNTVGLCPRFWRKRYYATADAASVALRDIFIRGRAWDDRLEVFSCQADDILHYHLGRPYEGET